MRDFTLTLVVAIAAVAALFLMAANWRPCHCQPGPMACQCGNCKCDSCKCK